MLKPSSTAGGLKISNWSFTIKFMAPAAIATAMIAVLTIGAVMVMNGQGQTIDRINNVVMPQVQELGDVKAAIKEDNGQLFRALTLKATDPTANASSKVNAVATDLGKIADRVKKDVDMTKDPAQKKLLTDLGQEVKAIVVVAADSSLTEEEVRAHCAEALASFKVPSQVELRREPLPRNPSGKVLKNVLSGDAQSNFVEE